MPTSIRKSHSLASLTEVRREIFHAVGWQVQVRAGVWCPPTDVYDTENDYIVRLEIAGMREEDFDITVENNILSITGVRPDIPERRAYHQMEIRFGKFESVVGLPGPVELDAARAEYKDGFLTITFPKTPPKDKS